MPKHHDYSLEPLKADSETPPPAPHGTGRVGRGRDGGFAPGDNPSHDCRHEVNIALWTQRDKHRWIVVPALVTLTVGVLITLSTCLYTQGQAAGSTAVRVQALEARGVEDRAATADRVERQRQQDTLEGQRHEELMQALHGVDARLGRVEERLSNRRPSAVTATTAPP
jgi:hypothetical protein